MCLLLLSLGLHPSTGAELCRLLSLVPGELPDTTTAQHVRSSWEGQAAITGPLIPELARLPLLESLIIIVYNTPVWAGIPSEWLLPGAFPSLKE